MPNEEAVVAAIKQAPEYRDYFAAAFPNESEPVNFKNITFAIGAFQRVLLTPA